MALLRVCYKDGVRFDRDYYISKHVPLASSIMGPYGVTNVEMASFGPGPDGSRPPYQVMFTASFDSPASLQNALKSPRIAEVFADIPNYYEGMPDILIGEVTPLPL